MDHILIPHFEHTVERCQAERTVLAIQDTTTLHDDGLLRTSDLDERGGGGKGSRGLLCHAGVAVNGVGHPLGMFAADAHVRRADDKDSTRWRQGLQQAQDLEHACEHTRVISVCDREGDFWDLLRHAHHTAQDLLVRSAKKNARQVVTADGSRAD